MDALSVAAYYGRAPRKALSLDASSLPRHPGEARATPSFQPLSRALTLGADPLLLTAARDRRAPPYCRTQGRTDARATRPSASRRPDRPDRIRAIPSPHGDGVLVRRDARGEGERSGRPAAPGAARETRSGATRAAAKLSLRRLKTSKPVRCGRPTLRRFGSGAGSQSFRSWAASFSLPDLCVENVRGFRIAALRRAAWSPRRLRRLR